MCRKHVKRTTTSRRVTISYYFRQTWQIACHLVEPTCIPPRPSLCPLQFPEFYLLWDLRRSRWASLESALSGAQTLSSTLAGWWKTRSWLQHDYCLVRFFLGVIRDLQVIITNHITVDPEEVSSWSVAKHQNLTSVFKEKASLTRRKSYPERWINEDFV